MFLEFAGLALDRRPRGLRAAVRTIVGRADAGLRDTILIRSISIRLRVDRQQVSAMSALPLKADMRLWAVRRVLVDHLLRVALAARAIAVAAADR
jgi:hypothetical protein